MGGAGAGQDVCSSLKNLMGLGSGHKHYIDLLKTVNVVPVGCLDQSG